jgi:peptide deformylase
LRVLVAEWTEEGDDEPGAQSASGSRADPATYRAALVNPEIIKRSKEELLGTEGCLSIPGYVGDNIRRAAAITVKARDPRGKEVRINAEGWFARILQHEIDHLDGILFTDRLDRSEDLRKLEPEEALTGAEGQPTPGEKAKPAPGAASVRRPAAGEKAGAR